mmetsp:Transcript_59388/g.145861  ORF Transcript_59388/g.145861 Transcript_59388/m.145861 type:complete len:81 (-) Transcript_59388:2623-2865(-)
MVFSRKHRVHKLWFPVRCCNVGVSALYNLGRPCLHLVQTRHLHINGGQLRMLKLLTSPVFGWAMGVYSVHSLDQPCLHLV